MSVASFLTAADVGRLVAARSSALARATVRVRCGTSRSPRRHLREHLAVAIAVDELHGHVEVEQTLDGFTRQRAGKDVASDHNAVHLGLTDLCSTASSADRLA